MINKNVLFLPALAFLAGCATVQQKAANPTNDEQGIELASGSVYSAYGTEPFWDLKLSAKTATFSGLGIEARSFPAPQPKPIFNGTRYVSGSITIDITRTDCSDGMSDREFDHTVAVTIDDKIYRGCGKPRAYPKKLDDTSWSLFMLNGKQLKNTRNTEPFIAFRSGKISGNAGCNNFSASYTLDGNQLTLGPILSTRMACPGGGSAQEQAVFAHLNGILTLSFDNEGYLDLTRNEVVLRIFPSSGAKF